MLFVESNNSFMDRSVSTCLQFKFKIKSKRTCLRLRNGSPEVKDNGNDRRSRTLPLIPGSPKRLYEEVSN
jgi:hypothetical protein